MDAPLFGLIVKLGVQVSPLLLLSFLFLYLYRVGLRPAVLSDSCYLPRDLNSRFSPSDPETILRDLLGYVQLWGGGADGGELVAKILV